MTRPTWLWWALAVSTAAHASFAWQLSSSPRVRRAPHDRDTFQVRMVALPPPAAPNPPAPQPPAPKPPPPAAARPKPIVKAPPPELAPPPAPGEPVQTPPAQPTTAPIALLADTGLASVGGVVQLDGAPIVAWSTASPLAETPRAPAAAAHAPAPLANLSDLSRKPKAPPLDAALRQNYPAELRRRGTEGQAEVRVVLDARGRVREVAVVSESATGFAEACRKTLIGSRWSEPLDQQGRAVSTRLTYRCRFQIER